MHTWLWLILHYFDSVDSISTLMHLWLSELQRQISNNSRKNGYATHCWNSSLIMRQQKRTSDDAIITCSHTGTNISKNSLLEFQNINRKLYIHFSNHSIRYTVHTGNFDWHSVNGNSSITLLAPAHSLK